MSQTFAMIAKTLPGLEPVLEQELLALGAQNVTQGRRMVSFAGDLAMLYKANLHLRTALRILKPIYEFEAEDPDLLYAALMQFNWGSLLAENETFAVDAVAYSSYFTHSRYVVYRTKDAIMDWFAAHSPSGGRPRVSVTNPKLLFHVHVAENKVTLSLDSSGESLHMRGYRVGQGAAPINEVLAAGILLKAGWQGQCDLLDPFCGSGTFLIEAALIARNIAPGIYREHFAFETWPDFDSALLAQLYDDDSAERPFEHHIYGSDIAPKAVSIAHNNIKTAGLLNEISVEVKDFALQSPVSPEMMLVMNPPYGERIRPEDTEALYRMIGATLKHRFSGSSAWIIAHSPEHFAAVGLRPGHRETLFNGALECELRGYTLFAGSNKEFKTAEAELQEDKKESSRFKNAGALKGRATSPKKTFAHKHPSDAEGERREPPTGAYKRPFRAEHPYRGRKTGYDPDARKTVPPRRKPYDPDARKYDPKNHPRRRTGGKQPMAQTGRKSFVQTFKEELNEE